MYLLAIEASWFPVSFFVFENMQSNLHFMLQLSHFVMKTLWKSQINNNKLLIEICYLFFVVEEMNWKRNFHFRQHLNT